MLPQAAAKSITKIGKDTSAKIRLIVFHRIHRTSDIILDGYQKSDDSIERNNMVFSYIIAGN